MKAFVLQPDAQHAWKARPGCRILVMGGGAVRFDFPQNWMAGLNSQYLQIVDRVPPDDRCGLMISYRMVSMRVAAYPMRELVSEITSIDSPDRPAVWRGPIVCAHRLPLEAVWRQMQFIDPRQKREACTRVCLARGGRTMATIVFDFWPEDELMFHEAWMTLLETLAVGDYVEDEVTGRKREMRG
jgi:hypothetical protein